MTTEVTPIRTEAVLPSMILSREETALLWQLVNNPNAAVPLKFASKAGELFRTVREYAQAHGIDVGS